MKPLHLIILLSILLIPQMASAWTVGSGSSAWSNNSSFSNVTKDNQGDTLVVGFDYNTFNNNTLSSWTTYANANGSVSASNSMAKLSSTADNSWNAELYKNYTFPSTFWVSALLNFSSTDAAYSYYYHIAASPWLGGFGVGITPVYTAFHEINVYSWYNGASWLDVFTTAANTTYETTLNVKTGTSNYDIYKNGTLQTTANYNSGGGTTLNTLTYILNGIIGSYYIDNIRLWNTTSGNVTVWYNFGSGYRGAQTKAIYTNNTNTFLDLYASSDNTTWYLVQSNASNNTYYNIPSSAKNQTQYVRSVLKGNGTSTPELYSMTILNELQTITLNYVSPTLPDNTYTNVNYTQVNISFSNTFADASLNTFIFNWNGTNTTYSNTSSSITNCSTSLQCFYINVTNLTDGKYSYYGWLNDTFGNSNSSVIRNITIDTIKPTIDFIPPTDANNSVVSRNYTFINTSVSDTNNITALIDFNNSLVGWWRFNEGNGTVAQDFSSYGNNGTLTNMNTGLNNGSSGWNSSGKFGNALSFDGVNDYVNVGNAQNLDMINSVTIETWIKTSNVGIYNIVIDRASSTNGRGGYALNLNNGKPMLTTGNATNYDDYTDTTSIADGTWHHIVGVYNGSMKLIYRDGILSSSKLWNNNIVMTTDNLTFGTRSDLHDYYFNGLIDEVRIYNRALSPEEINASYNTGLYRLYHNFTNLTDGTYNYTAYVQDAAGNVNSTSKQYVTIDTTHTITNLSNTTGNFYHNWTWTNPTDSSFNYTMIYINSTYVTNTSNNYYNLSANAHNMSTIGTRTVYTGGNINSTWVNNTSVIPNNPISIGNITNYTISEGSLFTIYPNYTDIDNDTPTFYNNITNMYEDNAPVYTTSLTYEKLKTIMITNQLRSPFMVSFYTAADSGGYMKIYKNGIPYGIEQVSSPGAVQLKSQVFNDVLNASDTIELWGRVISSIVVGRNLSIPYGVFNSSNGTFVWNTSEGTDGTYNWFVNTSDGYGSTSRQNFTINITDSTPSNITNLTNITGNFFMNWTYSPGTNTDRYAIQIDGVNTGYTTNLYYNNTYTPHASKTISVSSHNDTLNTNSSWTNNTSTIPNNIPILSSISDKVINENQWLNFSITGTDADNDTLTCGTNATKGSLSGCNFSWATAVGDASTYHINFNITDGYGGSANQTVTITVSSITSGGGGGGGRTTGGSFVSYTPSNTSISIPEPALPAVPASIISPPPAPPTPLHIYNNPILKVLLIILVASGVFVISETRHDTEIKEEDRKYRVKKPEDKKGSRVKTSNTRKSPVKTPDKK